MSFGFFGSFFLLCCCESKSGNSHTSFSCVVLLSNDLCSATDSGGGSKDIENDLVMIFFFLSTKRGRPWKPLGIIGAAVGFGKRPRIGVVLSCLLWSTCIFMAGQRTQLTVERVRKKGPAPQWIVGFCLLPKFALPSELLLQMGPREWKRRRGRPMRASWSVHPSGR